MRASVAPYLPALAPTRSDGEGAGVPAGIAQPSSRATADAAKYLCARIHLNSDASARSFQRVEKSPRLQAGALRRKDAQPPRALVQLLRERRKIDRSDPALARESLDFAAAPQDWNIESQHLRLDRIIQQQLTGYESELLREGVFRFGDPLPVG